VPELDVLVVEFPAQKHFAPTDDGGEIHEAAIGVFDEDLPAGELPQQFVNPGGGPGLIIDGLPARVRARGDDGVQPLLKLEKFPAQPLNFLQPDSDFRQLGAGLLAGVMAGELKFHGPVSPAGVPAWSSFSRTLGSSVISRDCFQASRAALRLPTAC
jgi:hypothetical protein